MFYCKNMKSNNKSCNNLYFVFCYVSYESFFAEVYVIWRMANIPQNRKIKSENSGNSSAHYTPECVILRNSLL